MDLSSLKPTKGATFKRKRPGRGHGSGLGRTAGRGEKGYHSRSGSKHRPWFEGGQMPIHRRLPKRGFSNSIATPGVSKAMAFAQLSLYPLCPVRLRHVVG